MSQTQSIIVYTNPLTQQFYESGNMFPLLCSIFVMGLVVFTLCWAIEEFLPRKVSSGTRKFLTYLSFGAGIVSLFFTYNVMAL